MKLEKGTILVVEDDNDTRHFMRFFLESDGYIVYEAIDGAVGIEMAKKHLPNIILMDMSMPVMDGLTATKHLRECSATSHLPILALTAHGVLYAKRAFEAGCNDLLSKPVDFELLNKFINKYVTGR